MTNPDDPNAVGVRITALWPDGTVVYANGFHDLEEQTRQRQWHKYSVNEFRAEMRRRAEIWAGRIIPVKDAEVMFRAMEDCGMVRLDMDETGGAT